jgi:hypothetical protein
MRDSIIDHVIKEGENLFMKVQYNDEFSRDIISSMGCKFWSE